jgi:hypothetical protein
MQDEQQPRPALPLLVLLALASALGVAVAVALAGVAILLAAPAYAQEGNARAGGLLLERAAGLAPAELVFARDERLDALRRRVVEAYHNPYDEPLPGLYLFRLPPGAVLERLDFTRDDAEPRHAVLTLRRAATLVERTAPIDPGDTLVVEIEYRTPGAPISF